jgi:hypothetical protein
VRRVRRSNSLSCIYSIIFFLPNWLSFPFLINNIFVFPLRGFGTILDEMVVFMTKMTFKREFLVVHLLNMCPTIQCNCHCLWKAFFQINFKHKFLQRKTKTLLVLPYRYTFLNSSQCISKYHPPKNEGEGAGRKPR